MAAVERQRERAHTPVAGRRPWAANWRKLIVQIGRALARQVVIARRPAVATGAVAQTCCAIARASPLELVARDWLSRFL